MQEQFFHRISLESLTPKVRVGGRIAKTVLQIQIQKLIIFYGTVALFSYLYWRFEDEQGKLSPVIDAVIGREAAQCRLLATVQWF
ncbi:MAG: hypothetical protein HYZ45_01845 [Burkholderiales bacterium]|nr:hypothetical protein [Burkholderiales bacterium]